MATIERDVKTQQNTARFKVPEQLRTPTDLTGEAVETITQALNQIVADTLALYVKTKNYHWHLASSHFRDYHLLFDEQAEQLLNSVDILAERVRRIGGTTIRSISHIQELQTIADDNDAFVSPAEMLQRLLTGNLALARQQREAVEASDELRDHATSSLLEVLLDETEKRIWFLYEARMGASDSQDVEQTR